MLYTKGLLFQQLHLWQYYILLQIQELVNYKNLLAVSKLLQFD